MMDKMLGLLHKVLGPTTYAVLKKVVARALGLFFTCARTLWTRVRLLGYPGKRRLFLLDMATHPNIGDAAISLAEVYFVRKHYAQYAHIFGPEIALSLAGERGVRLWAKLARPGDVLLLHGGGNLGNRYPHCDRTRRFLIRHFAKCTVISFPFSVSWLPGDRAAYIAESRGDYELASSLTLFFRDTVSLEAAHRDFPQVRAEFAPDIALSLVEDYRPNASQRHGIYFCFRNDAEGFYPRADIQALQQQFVAAGHTTAQGDTQYHRKLTFRNRERVVLDTIAKHGCFRVVLTDRLHGMVFSIIARTPCVVLRNCDHKLAGMYQTVSAWPYVRFAENLQEAYALVQELAQADTATIPAFAPDYASLLAQVRASKVFEKGGMPA